MPFWMIPKEVVTTTTVMDLPHPSVTAVLWKVTGREVIPGTAFRSQPEPNWLIQLSLQNIVEHMLQDG